MQAIKKPQQRKQEILNKFFWLRTFLINPGPDVRVRPKATLKTALIETVWNAQTAYMQADDDDYNFGIATEAYQMIENALMAAGIDIETSIKTTMEKNGYTNLMQMKPVGEKVLAAIRVFDEGKAPADPWD